MLNEADCSNEGGIQWVKGSIRISIEEPELESENPVEIHIVIEDNQGTRDQNEVQPFFDLFN